MVQSIAEALQQDFGAPDGQSAAGRSQRLFRWQCEAEALEYCSTEARWTVRLRAPDGGMEALTVHAVAVATGGQSRAPPEELLAATGGAVPIPQQDALAPSRLRPHLPDPQAPVALVGNSHSVSHHLLRATATLSPIPAALCACA